MTQLLSNNKQPVWTADQEIEGWFDKLASLLGECKEPAEGEGRLKLYLNGLPSLSVTEVAFRCGFNSSQYFAAVFRAAKGCTPTSYAARR